MSEAVNFAFQWIFVLNLVKHKFFHVKSLSNTEAELKKSVAYEKSVYNIESNLFDF